MKKSMLRTSIVVALLSFIAACATQPSSSTLPVVGSWKIVAWETVHPDGTITYPFVGKQPIGLIVYQSNGLMSVQVMRDPRPPVPVSGSTFRATQEEKSVAFSGYYAYWGRYTMNATDNTVTHQVTASLWPQEVGITYKRTYALDGDRLVLTTPPFPIDGHQAFNRLTWQRVGDTPVK
jgi:Lipocalin-like domain